MSAQAPLMANSPLSFGAPVLTDSELYDRLVSYFGYGTWDEVAADEKPYWKYRMTEISKVAASRKKNDCSVVEAGRIADYCHAHRIVITGPHKLWWHRSDAKKWWEEQQTKLKHAALDGAIEDAIAHEAEQPDSPWLDRLVRATGPYREEVYEAWLKSRTPT